MSAYVNFFIRNKDNFIPLGSYSRNSGIYSIISENMVMPWEKITNITYNTLKDWTAEADSEINRMEKEIDRIEKMFELANSYTLEDAYDYAGVIDECRENIEEIKGIKAIFGFMENILDEYKYGDNFSVLDTLYFGMEIGNPTVEDII